MTSNPKSTFLNLFTKAQASRLLYCWIILRSISDLFAPLKWDQSHCTTLHFDVYTHQSTEMDLTAGICNTLQACLCQNLSAILWLQCY